MTDQKIPVIITAFNQVSWLRRMVDDLTKSGVAEPMIIDNASTYPGLLEYLDSAPCRVIRHARNAGPRVAWENEESAEVTRAGYYVVTDSDLGLSSVDIPAALADCRRALDRWPELIKAGLSLRVNDLPMTAIGNRAADWERQFWCRKSRTRSPRGHRAAIDTTFALYRPGAGWGGYSPAWRSEHSARHEPWYLLDGEIPDDYRHAIENSDHSQTTWTSFAAGQLKAAATAVSGAS